MFTNFYKTLDIPDYSDIQAIKKAYRQNALKYHPDKNNNNPETNKKFIEISEAYKILTENKSVYDEHLRNYSKNPSQFQNSVNSDQFYNYGNSNYSGYQQSSRPYEPFFIGIDLDTAVGIFRKVVILNNNKKSKHDIIIFNILLNWKLLIIVILVSLYFFHFFDSYTGYVYEKFSFEKLGGNIVRYRLGIVKDQKMFERLLAEEKNGTNRQNDTRRQTQEDRKREREIYRSLRFYRTSAGVYNVVQENNFVSKKMFNFNTQVNDAIVDNFELKGFVIYFLIIYSIGVGLIFLYYKKRMPGLFR